MTHLKDTEILDRLIAVTQAKPYVPTAAEAQEKQELAEFSVQSEKDRQRMLTLTKRREHEELLIQQARAGSGAAAAAVVR